MKSLYKKTLVIGSLLFFNLITSQSYEETSIVGVTDTPSASRSANFVDVNGDGWDDIFFSNGPSSGQNNMLYINNKNGTFTPVLTDDIVLDDDRSDGASFSDVDNDGDLDVFVVTYGFGSNGHLNYFYRNNGDGSFTYEPSIAMGLDLTFSEMATWVDINNDQFLDLYFTNSNGNQENLYYENQGDGSFLQITNLSITNENLKSRSIDWIDYDNDGDCDLFVTNEENSKNSLFRNDGPDNFTQITGLSIVQDFKTTAGSSWADIDNDGDFDLFIANWEGENNQLFINNNGVFVEQIGSVIASGGGNSFGSSFGDMDNDGDLDLFVCNAYFTGQTKNFVYINDGNGNFTQDTSSDLANHIGYTFGCAFGDYDHDGWLDIILANTINENQSNSLFHNTGSGNNWIKILCKGTTSNFSAVGAKIKITANINGNTVIQTRKIAASSGYCSQNSYTNHFGLGNATIVDDIEVQWPSGAIESFVNKDANGFYIIEEGTGIFLGTTQVDLQDKVTAYSNPVNNQFTFEATLPLEYSNLNFKIIDLQGRIIKSINNIQPIGNELTLKVDISNLIMGTYIYFLNNYEKRLLHGKIIKN